MKIHRATRLYELWLAKQTLRAQRPRPQTRLMKRDAFSFFRATFYRWMQVWPEVCADLVTAPVVRAVGDLHVENFGTWRDSEGRLIWGINDFDEAYPLPYTIDLVRLAVSATLAIKTTRLTIKPTEAYDAIFTGYTEGLKSGGRPFVLAEQHRWLRDIATNALRDPVGFWQKMEALPPVKGAMSNSAQAALDHLMPEPACHIVSGDGYRAWEVWDVPGSSHSLIGREGRSPVKRKRSALSLCVGGRRSWAHHDLLSIHVGPGCSVS